MGAELHELHGGRARWRFSLGCARALAVIRAQATLSSREPGGAALRAVVLAGIAAAVGLAVYGLIRYPHLRSDQQAWASMAAFLALVCAYAALTLALSRGTTLRAVAARRHGLAGGLVSGGAWFVVLSPPGALKESVLLPLVVALLAPACAARPGRNTASASRAALWIGIVGGLVVAITWVTAAYVRHGRPYDAGLLRDFHSSGAPDLATYAVRGDLATGLELLVLIPLLALAFGSLARLRARPAS